MKCVGKKDWLYEALNIKVDDVERLALLSKNFAAVRDNIHSTLIKFNIENLP